ncbi:MAG: hypothetical protein VB018_06345 [Lachnospiraceae bacterium]|nr:hypothetical protein [Lachnospiraceae bacterium]
MKKARPKTFIKTACLCGFRWVKGETLKVLGSAKRFSHKKASTQSKIGVGFSFT